MKKIKGFKTLVYGLLIAGLAVFSNAEMQAFAAQHMEWLGGLMGLGVIILRALTNSPILKSAFEPPPAPKMPMTGGKSP